MSRDPGNELRRLLEVMVALRDPETGCPWDVEQTFATIAPFTIEEAYEVADAVARGDLDDLCSELGDLLLQVVYHARMAEEAGRFDFADVTAAIADKMTLRHPHVFAEQRVSGVPELHIRWEERKAAERAAKGATDGSILADVPIALPALTRAAKLQKRAARVGLDWQDVGGVLAKVAEEARELAEAPDGTAQEAELGDLLFTVVNLARHLALDPEEALRKANRRFEGRVRRMEAEAGDLHGLDAVTLDRLWNRAKGS